MILHANLHDEPFESVPKNDAFFNVDKMLHRAEKLDDGMVPSTFGRDSFIFVYHPETQHVYFFPGLESENLDNDAERVKRGLAFFLQRGFIAYSFSQN